MNTLQLLKALPCTDISVGGVYPADKLPVIWPRPCAIIANKDNHNQPGSHWIALHVDRTGHGIYFDSLGCKPTDIKFAYALRRNSVVYEYNDRRLQDYASNVCGNYCIVALHWFANGGRLSSFQRMFTNDYEQNDKYVMSLYKKIIKKTDVKRNKYFHLLSGSGLSIQQSYCNYIDINKW